MGLAVATVAVAVANVWAVPGTATIPNDWHVWPTPAVTYDQRRALVGHMPTQVLYGERVVVLDRRGAWTKVAVPDQPSPLDPRGYPGWMLNWQLRKALPVAETVTVTAPRARLSTGAELELRHAAAGAEPGHEDVHRADPGRHGAAAR